MPVVDTTQSFATGDTVTSTTLNNIMDQSIFVAGAVVSGSGLAITAGGQMTINNLPGSSITPGTITSTQISDGTIVNADINASAAIELSKLATGALPTAITIASANIVDGTIVADDIANATITATKLNGAQSGTAPVFGCRAWVNFNGQANSDLGGTYSRSGTTSVTITATAHGLIVGNRVFLDFTVGAGTAPFDGIYEVATVIDANSFTVISSTTTASTGTILLKRKTIRSSGNISCVSAAQANPPAIPPTSNQTPDNGYYIVNFATAMPNSNFAISGVVNQDGTLSSAGGNDILGGFGFNEKCAYVTTISVGSTAVDCLYNNIIVIG